MTITTAAFRHGRWPLAALLLLAAALPGRARAFGLDDVAAQARALAREPYRDRQPHVPDWMRVGSMTYDQWRDIRFRPERALWHDRHLPFEVQFFHPGLYFDRSVTVHVVDGETVRDFPYASGLFDFGKNDFASRVPPDVGFAGLRIHGALKTPAYFDEIAVFLGASYFRALGRDNVYGLSARGLAVDTARPRGEEFPNFTELWLVTPAPGARDLTLYALLDGPTASGAYRFVVHPGVATTMDVDVRLFLRRRPETLGLAPLTSMFFFGENTTRHFADFRPEVHDSDGLLLHFDTGEWLWRPLDNPPRIDVASFRMHDPRGFGLLQRDRAFSSYEDLETRAELRPSAWVEPRGDWGEGHVELIELPTGDELTDNVVAFWVPARLPAPGEELPVAYRLSWYGDDPALPPGGRAVATRRDRGSAGTARDGHRYVIDFEGAALAALDAGAPPRGVVTASRGTAVSDVHVTKNPVTGGWRLAFQIRPQGTDPVELRAYLERQGRVLTETWSADWLE